MTASDYEVTFPYGATSAPYSSAHPHRGDDHPCPAGTPLVINGVTLGLTGATGKVIGAHLHIQEWQGDYATTRKPQNAFQPGTVTNIDPNGTQGDGSFGKFITIQIADGWNDTYCHLSRINVTVGQVIGGDMTKKLTSTDQVRQLYLSFGIEIAGDNPILQKWVNDGGTDYDLMLGLAAQVQNTLKVQGEALASAGQVNKQSVLNYLNSHLG